MTVGYALVPPNHPPVAAADSYNGTQDTPLTIAAPGVLANDSDADGDSLTAVLVTSPAHGALALNANGGFSYTPAAGYSGADSFTYKANDGKDDSAVATVTLTIAATPAPQTDVIVSGDQGTPKTTVRTGQVLDDQRERAPAGLRVGRRPAGGRREDDRHESDRRRADLAAGRALERAAGRRRDLARVCARDPHERVGDRDALAIVRLVDDRGELHRHRHIGRERGGRHRRDQGRGCELGRSERDARDHQKQFIDFRRRQRLESCDSADAGPNQALVHQFLAPVDDTYWVQRFVPAIPVERHERDAQ